MAVSLPLHATSTKPARRWARLAQFMWLNTFVRGFVGALSAITLLADAVGLESYDAARAIHAVVVGWSTVTRQIGELIGLLPFIPKLDAAIVNTMVFMGTVTVPALFGIRRFMQPVAIPDLPRWSLWWMNWAGPIMLGYIFVFGTIAFQGGDVTALRLHQPASTLLAFVDDAQRLSLFAVCVVSQFVIACWLKPFRIGLLTLLGVLLAVELLYFAPAVGPIIKAWSEGVIEGRATLGTVP